jgi:hypothetical protein
MSDDANTMIEFRLSQLYLYICCLTVLVVYFFLSFLFYKYMRFLFDRQPSFFAIFFDSEKMKSDVKKRYFFDLSFAHPA